MQSDAVSLALMLCVAGFTLAAAIGWIARGQGVGGLRALVWGLVAFGCAAPLVAIGAVAEAAAPAVLGQFALSSSLSLALAGILRFHGRPANPLATLAPLAIVALMLGFAGGAAASAVAPIQALQAAGVAVAVHRRRNAVPGRAHRLVALGAMLGALVLVAGTAAGVVAVAGMADLAAPPIVTGHALALAAMLLFAAGLLGMIKERADERSRQLALHDDLTGIANRRALLEALARLRAASLRRSAPLCVLRIDVDRFRRVNDRFGHAAGDVALARVAEAIRGRLRAQDTLGRYGGAEFVALLPDTTEAGGLRVAQDLCERLAALPIAAGRASVRVTLSIGARGGLVWPDETPADLLRMAEDALRRARRLGRNRAEGSESPDDGLLASA